MHYYAIIRPALVLTPGNSKRCKHLGPDYGRVTTALRGVVTRPLPAWQHVRQAMPVTQFALVCIWQPSVVQTASTFFTIGLTNLNFGNAFLVVGWFRSYACYILRKCQREIAVPVSPDHGLQIAER